MKQPKLDGMICWSIKRDGFFLLHSSIFIQKVTCLLFSACKEMLVRKKTVT